jgi:hypothetical protein
LLVDFVIRLSPDSVMEDQNKTLMGVFIKYGWIHIGVWVPHVFKTYGRDDCKWEVHC